MKFGTDESVLAHEIGHQLEWKYDMWDWFAKQAERRWWPVPRRSSRPSPMSFDSNPQVIRKFEIARGAAATRRWRRWCRDIIGARDLMKRVAPNVLNEFEHFIAFHPDLHPLRSIEANMMHASLDSEIDAGGLVVKGHWWAPEGAARILNNYLMPGLRAKSGAYRAVLGLNNVMNQFQLGYSAFHLGFTSMDARTSKAALGFRAGVARIPIEGTRVNRAVSRSSITTYLKGSEVLREWSARAAPEASSRILPTPRNLPADEFRWMPCTARGWWRECARLSRTATFGAA